MKQTSFLCIVMFLCFLSVVNSQNSLKVMTFNKLYSTSSNSALNVVRASGADVIGLQESYGAARSIANSLGFYYHSVSSSVAVISRYPITSTNSSGVEITLPDGLKIYVFNAHLTSYPYEPYEIRDRNIRSESAAINSANRTRGNEMTSIINTIQSWVPAGAPVFFTGDFNEPSHLDWTTRAANANVHALKVAWPASRKATNVGLKDSWREVYPNEILNPGDTWTPRRSSNEVYDRIDIIYHRGTNVVAKNAVRYGPTNDEAEVKLSNYTSDHRAMMVTYDIPEENGVGDNGGDSSYGDNLLNQYSAEESNLSSWTQVSGSSIRVRGGRNGYPTAKQGNYIFWFGNSSSGEVYQDVNVQSYANAIDNGLQSFYFEGFIRSYRGNDRARIKLEYRSSNDNVLSSFDSGWKNRSSSWEEVTNERIAPAGTRKIRVVLLSERNRGTSNDGYLDAISLRTKENNISRRANVMEKEEITELENVFKVWPNPAVNTININNIIAGEVAIIDVLGIVKKKVIVENSNAEVSVSDLSKGLYVVQFTSKNGTVKTKSLVIK
ncbi:endonuclease/exonuclease/phosphatase family protein [uncultured Tenacibaculum sp.]|uniref:endonuclease/exonuclease/phosphatase family protein n=1 Tax=uncultured Tenacibaculum sp. TaxID=174713 RepID=UPI00260FE10D|nr:endonuclease/exonuclease/phosphatase family protein [uncultured Tenacibaculum sp.]